MTERIRYESAERVRDYYRNQGVAKERERILKHIENRIAYLVKFFPNKSNAKDMLWELNNMKEVIEGETK